MITRLLVIQKISRNGKVEVLQVSSDYFQWAFEHRRPMTNTDGEYFPFSFSGDPSILKRPPGPETEVFAKKSELSFKDDYGVPAGTVIAVLLPRGYIPDILKFKNKPYIPAGLVGQVTTTPPGQIQLLYNGFEKVCAIIFNIHENIVFGFKCVARRIDDSSYPKSGQVFTDDIFDVLVSRDLLKIGNITTQDLEIFNKTLDRVDLSDIHQTLNEILYALKHRNRPKAQSLIEKVEGMMLNGSSVASNITTIVDSYKNGGITHQFIAKILEYASL